MGPKTLNQPCGDTEPTFAQSCASTDALLSNPSSSTHTDSRVHAAASLEHAGSRPGDCEGIVHTQPCLPRGWVATTGRATSIGLSVLIGIEREAAIELAGGKLTTGVAVHTCVHSNRAPGTTTPLRLPSQRNRRGQGFVRTRCANLRLSWRRHPCLDHTSVLKCPSVSPC